MSVSITHAKVSGKPAGSDPERVYGTHWDADHVVPVATTAEAEAATSDTVLMTPAKTLDLINALPATESVAGIVELATTAESQAGADTSRAITAAGLRAATREKLTASRTYYVRTDGSDSNTGLANTSGGAFLTGQKAWDTVAALDLSIYTVTIQYASGTYTGGISMTAMPLGGSGIIIQGDTSTPSNVHINRTATCFSISAPLPCAMQIKGFKCTFAGADARAIYLTAPGAITTSAMELAGGSSNYAGAYTASVGGAQIFVSTGQTISGGMSCFLQAAVGGYVEVYGITVTLTGTPAFSWVTVAANSFGYVGVGGVTFSGAATGVRYNASTNGGINTNGGGASFIPGSSGGSTSSNGWYN